jgi:ADP-ribosylglycohydrolase
VVEGYPPEVCREYIEVTLSEGHPRDRRRGRYAFGQYSDDSQLARELMQSYAACGRFDPEDYARRVAAIFSEGRIVEQHPFPVGPGRSGFSLRRTGMMAILHGLRGRLSHACGFSYFRPRFLRPENVTGPIGIKLPGQ